MRGDGVHEVVPFLSRAAATVFPSAAEALNE
eukprot:CAMPEP_0182946388 /NCGR_PEP_ID=MMETSP0105_2-20130417/57012_1 /TAXON_ID=81532 ORGANISM="Acanthoeca-like sp., Strain 10tr" /NCGR_SAMPLE_ID=MMETSP0105_2 /ASSEMBLY_ACC=CAM_ASM_000205 /LENGTH=30 /DNA_ID= /DNA_START= /DNA_END= /DNA_ORIENTATION=